MCGLWTKKSYQSVKDLIIHMHRELIVTFSCLLEVSTQDDDEGSTHLPTS